MTALGVQAPRRASVRPSRERSMRLHSQRPAGRTSDPAGLPAGTLLPLGVLALLDELTDALTTLVAELRVPLRSELLLASLSAEAACLADSHRATGALPL